MRGEQVILSNLLGWSVFSAIFVLSAILCMLVVPKKQEKFTPLEILSLGISGSPVLLSVACFLIVSLKGYSVLLFMAGGLFLFQRNREFVRKIFAAAGANMLRFPKTRHYTRDGLVYGTFFALLLVNLLLVKYGYIYGLQLPLNTDSVNHTRQISFLARNDFLGLPYYHYAFHYIVIALNWLTGVSVAKTILIFGQLLQMVAPITVFYPAYAITKNRKAALFAVFVAGFVWTMPSQATGWGKYPALLAMVSIPFVLFHLRSLTRLNQHTLGQSLLPVLICITAIFIHSRMLMVMIIGVATLLFAGFLDRKGMVKKPRASFVLLCCSLPVLVIILLLAGHMESWKYAFSPYTGIMLAALILLLPFGASSYSQALPGIEVFILLSLFFTVIPFPAAIDYFNAGTLIDGPFLSILLFIPLSILLGMNFAGFEQFVGSRFGQRIPNMLPVLLAVLLLLFPNQKVLAPSPDVNFVTANDLLLYDEIKNRMPGGIEIVIPNASPYYDLGVDGGAWINYVTGRKTIAINYEADLASYTMFAKMCRTGARYVYLGSKPYSFSIDTITRRKRWYRPLIYYPDVKLYKMTGCPSE